MLPAGRVHVKGQGCGKVNEKLVLVTCLNLFHLESVNKQIIAVYCIVFFVLFSHVVI